MINNLTKKNIISHNPIYATSLMQRTRGMLFNNFDNFDAMVFNNCHCIHTMFMQIKIDILFVDCENCICDLRKELLPWRLMVRSKQALSVIELPEGSIERLNIEIGDIVDINAELTMDAKEQLNDLLSSPEVAITMKMDIKK